MVLLRQVVRFVVMLLWLPVIGLISLPFKLGGWNSIRRVCFCSRIWGRGIARIMNIRITVHGDISQFRGGLIVSNHQGYLDIFSHASVFPIRFAPKSDIRSWPLLGWYLGISRPIWVNRTSRQKSSDLLHQFCETMEHHIPLIIYPEGTSTDGKHGILPFKSTPFEAIATTNLPLLPIITVYDDPPDGRSLAWFGKDALVPHIVRVFGYPEIRVNIYVLPVIYPEGRSRKELAAHVHEVMERRYWEIMAERGFLPPEKAQEITPAEASAA